LVCIEMLIAAIFHLFAFPYQHFVIEGEPRTPLLMSFWRVINVHDVVKDTHKHILPRKTEEFSIMKFSFWKSPFRFYETKPASNETNLEVAVETTEIDEPKSVESSETKPAVIFEIKPDEIREELP